MTHTTGPRKNMVDGLAKVFLLDIDVSKANITESMEALHEANMALAHLMLRPWEEETCPTCPKEMKERGDEILKEREMAGEADELAKRGEKITRQRELLRECLEAMNDATRRYRTMAAIAGNCTEVPGWVAWLDQMQEKVTAELYREVRR